jgi:hypothetical protein
MLRVCPDMMRMGICRGEVVTGVLDVCLDYTRAGSDKNDDMVNKDDIAYEDTNDKDIDQIVTPKKTETLTSFLAQFQMRNLCNGEHVSCLYGNRGDLTQMIQSRSLIVDGRPLVSLQWFNKHRGEYMTFDRYLHDDNYGAGQPGVQKIDYNRGREQIVAKLGNDKQRMMRALGHPAMAREYQIHTDTLVSGAHDVTNAIQKRSMRELDCFEKSRSIVDAVEFPTMDE